MNVRLITFAFCAISTSAIADEEPKTGLLGFPLKTPLLVEGQSAAKSLNTPRVMVTTLNSNKLSTPVEIPLRRIRELPPNIHVILRGYEVAEERKGVGIRDWKVFGLVWYETFFVVTDVIEPAGITLEK